MMELQDNDSEDAESQANNSSNMESRSIDTAKNATVDLMTLNKKVVNLRSVVRRSKVHLINKLTRNIASLKAKKGSEEEKKKNLEKAQRFLDEIESIRILRDDKITKYSLGNVFTFEEIARKTSSPGERALARLADHQFIKSAVKQFRDEHSDWRDLVAFLLMQQTGRRFKASQKKNKKSVRLENIQASRLMTESFNQGLFREEALQAAKDKFEKERIKKMHVKSEAKIETKESSDAAKDRLSASSSGLSENKENDGRKRLEVDSGTDSIDSFVNLSKDKSKLQKNDPSTSKICVTTEDTLNKEKKRIEDVSTKKFSTVSSTSKLKKEICSESGKKKVVQKENSKSKIADKQNESEEEMKEEDVDEVENEDNDSDEKVEEDDNLDEDDMEQDSEEQPQDEEDSDNDDKEEEDEREQEEAETFEMEEFSLPSVYASTSDKKSDKAAIKIDKREKDCVVKQLDMGSDDDANDTDGDIMDDSDANSDISDSDNADTSEDKVSESDKEEASEKETDNSVKQSKRTLSKKGKNLPDFLTKSEDKPHRLPRDPFFEGGDYGDDDDEDMEVDHESGDMNNYDDVNMDDVHEKYTGNKRLTKSLFYKPGDEKKAKRAGGGSQNWKKDASGGGMGRGRGGGRGDPKHGNRGGFQDRKPGSGGRGGHNKSESSRGRGSSFGAKPESRQPTNNTSFGGSKSSSSKQPDSKPKSTLPEKLHPSWEASRKRKAQQSGIKAFAGTKITFDD